MLFKRTLQLNRLAKLKLARASWDSKELTIPADEKPILSIKYDPKFISVLGYHNTITPEGNIES